MAGESDATIKKNALSKNNEVVIRDDYFAQAKGELLKDFDRLCKEHEIEYFVFGDLLRGAIHYNDFIPGKASSSSDIGLIRSQYDKLCDILKKYADEYAFIYDDYYDNSVNKRLLIQVGRNLVIQIPELYVNKTVWLYISPFDKVPTPRDYQYSQYKKIDRLNTRYLIQTKNGSISTFGQLLAKKWHERTGGAPKLYNKLIKRASKYNDVQTFDTLVRVQGKKSERIKAGQLYPIQRVKFRDFEVSVPNDYSPWTVIMDDKLRFQIESIQKADLEILKEFDRICKKLNIGYFVCGGTMLGYVRNGGFIPWDDDIDIGMLRADYDRFLAEGGKELGERFFLQTRKSDPKIPYLFSKIRMNQTEYITEYNEGRKFHKGICLDLFPFDYIPNSPKDQLSFKNEVLEMARRHNLISNMCIPEPKDGKILGFADFWARITHKVSRLRYRVKSMKRSQKKYIKTATRYNSRAKELGLTTVASFVPGYTFIKLEDLLPYRDIIFEGVPAKVPNKAEVFLEMQYGDYMKLPDKHQQIGHPLVRWSVDTTKGFYENPNMRR